MSSHREQSTTITGSAAYAMISFALLIAVVLVVLPRSAHAVVAATHLTEGGDGSQLAVYTTASISPTANDLVLAWVVSSVNGGAPAPTLTGNGLAWVQVNTVTWNGEYRLTLFRAMGAAPTAGSVTITYPGAQKSCVWTIDQYAGVDTSGTNGSGAIAQNITGANDAAGPAGLTLTLPLAIGGGNATAGGFSNAWDSVSISPGAGYTGFPEAVNSNPPMGILSEWRSAGSTTVNATQSGSYPIAGIAVEIKILNLSIVKQLWEVNGTAPVSSPATVAKGATFVFLIYVKNTGAVTASDIRINDILDQTGFDYVPGSMVRTSAVTPPADTATDLQIFQATAPGTGTALTDVASNADVGSAQDTGPPAGVDRITIGAVTGQANRNLNIGAHDTFAFRFQVKIK